MSGEPMVDIFTKIRGISYHQGSVKWCKPGTNLILIRDPKNIYDPNAVRVCVVGGMLIKKQRDLGFLSEDMAEEFSHLIDAGLDIKAVVCERTGKHHRIRGVNILLSFSKPDHLKVLKEIEKQFYKDRARRVQLVKQVAIDAEQKEALKRVKVDHRKKAVKASIVTFGKAIKYAAYRIGDGDPALYKDQSNIESINKNEDKQCDGK